VSRNAGVGRRLELLRARAKARTSPAPRATNRRWPRPRRGC
jgi:hypothetical protein